MQNLRHQRVRELLKRELGEIFRREFPVDDTGLITVSDVGVANDLHSATVFVSIQGTYQEQQDRFKQVQKARRRIQGQIGHAVALKYTPKLRFVMDDSTRRGDRVLEILEELGRSSSTQTNDEENPSQNR